MINISIDPQVMKNAVTSIIDQLVPRIDVDQLHSICKERYGIEKLNGIEHKGGDVVVIDNKVVCRLDFEVCFPVSVYMCSGGNIASEASTEDNDGAELEDIDFDDLDEKDLIIET